MRTALYEAVNVLVTPVGRFSALKRWALEVAKRPGMKRAKVAVARKLEIVLHRLWVDGTVFRWGKQTEHQNRSLWGGMRPFPEVPSLGRKTGRPWSGRIQAVVATRILLPSRSHSSSTSAGVLQLSVFLGLELREAATAAISSALCTLRSVPFGKY